MRFKVLSLFAASVIFVSCQKETTDAPIVPVVKDTPVLLTKLIVLDTLNPIPADTVAIYRIEYDQQFKPSTLEYLEYLNQGFVRFKGVMIYEYTGADSLASKTTMVETSFTGASTATEFDTTYYFYQSDKLVKDSTRGNNNPEYYEVNNYVYQPDRIERTSQIRTSLTNISIGNSVFYQQFNNGNLEMQHDTIAISSSGTTYFSDNNYTITYIPNPDPFYRIVRPIRRSYYDEADFSFVPVPRFVNPYLISSQQQTHEYWTSSGGGNSGSNVLSYSYTFRPDGFPIVLKQTSIQSGSFQQYYKVLYYYNK